MPEHIHLLISEPEIADPSVVMKVIKQRSALMLRRPRPAPAQSRLEMEQFSILRLWRAGPGASQFSGTDAKDQVVRAARLRRRQESAYPTHLQKTRMNGPPGPTQAGIVATSARYADYVTT